jgi:O-acetylhomoserine/O-acetylserine sulfhydrylase-like pyridoxal-dependent enzyme
MSGTSIKPTRKLGPSDIPKGMAASKILSPRRKSSDAESVEELALEQLQHFGIDPESDYGKALFGAAPHLYRAQAEVHDLWQVTRDTIWNLDRTDRVAYFNAKKFLSFQIAKILDTVQNPFRKAYQALAFSDGTLFAKGPYPVFDNVTAIFAANPVIVRTATYIYACTEWVEEAFEGREMLHEIYSRLLNPTSISLANYIVDIEAGPYASQYLAWNFNSGMAAIDATLSLTVSRGDVVVASRGVYGGTYQLLHDFYAREEKLDIALEWFDGYGADEFAALLDEVHSRHADAISGGAKVHVFMESPCNPHGYVVDIPAICKVAHGRGHTVILDSTVATPFLSKPLQRADREERPDYLIHSYTKDLTGNGNATAGVVIAENHLMFIPKGDSFKGVSWEETMFWGVYYIKGAFLDADKAFEVMSGIKTLELRMLEKCSNTIVLARYLDSHPSIHVCSNICEGNPNAAIRERVLKLGLPAPLFTIDLEGAGVPHDAFVRFFDCLDPAFNHGVTLGQSNTVVLCPAFTSHSELDAEALKEAGIAPTTIRIAVGDENPKELMAHFLSAARLVLDPVIPDFTAGFMDAESIDRLVRDTYLEVHRRYVESLPAMADIMGRNR